VVGRFNEKKRKNVLVSEVFKNLFDEKQNEQGINKVLEIIEPKKNKIKEEKKTVYINVD
jgi:hypothetical protein